MGIFITIILQESSLKATSAIFVLKCMLLWIYDCLKSDLSDSSSLHAHSATQLWYSHLWVQHILIIKIIDLCADNDCQWLPTMICVLGLGMSADNDCREWVTLTSVIRAEDGIIDKKNCRKWVQIRRKWVYLAYACRGWVPKSHFLWYLRSPILYRHKARGMWKTASYVQSHFVLAC